MKELERVSTYGPPTVPAVVILAVDRPDLAIHTHTHCEHKTVPPVSIHHHHHRRISWRHKSQTKLQGRIDKITLLQPRQLPIFTARPHCSQGRALY